MQKYPSINGLRAFSILLVITSHLAFNNGLVRGWEETTWALNLLKFLIQDGQLGVNIFFVVSGFLITALLMEEERRTGTISLKKFYIRRMLRIFPAYYFILLVYLFLQIAGYLHLDPISWLTSLTFTKQFWRTDWYTAHFWSLSVEEIFYLVWPFIFLGGDRLRKWVAVLFFVLVPVIRTLIYFHPVAWVHELTLFTRMDAIALGCLFAIYRDKIVERCSPYWTYIFVFSMVALFISREFPFFLGKIGLAFVFIPLGLTHGTTGNILVAFIMMYSVFGPRRLWFRLLNSSIMNYVGLLSYSIYLWQQFFISEREDWINQAPQNVVFMLLAAMGSYHLIEKPFLRLKNRFPPTPVPAVQQTELVASVQ